MAEKTEPIPHTLRRAIPQDAAALASLTAVTFEEAFAADNRPDDIAAHQAHHYSPAHLAAELADPRGTYFLAERGGNPAGYAWVVAGRAFPISVTGPRPVELARLYLRRHALG
ncbi:MAG: hypothetical protein M3O15_14440, partial [Acidobacteriota bacterium]|nr:hypothetical protein [Acidobacteriota bacterium]